MLARNRYRITGIHGSRLQSIIDALNTALDMKANAPNSMQNYGILDESGNVNSISLMLMDDIFYSGSNAAAPTAANGETIPHELPHAVPARDSGLGARDRTEQGVNIQTDNSDPAESVSIGGKNLMLRRSKQKEIMDKTADRISELLVDQKFILDEQEYLISALKIKSKLAGSFPMGHPKTEADRWMDEELKIELRRRVGV